MRVLPAAAPQNVYAGIQGLNRPNNHPHGLKLAVSEGAHLYGNKLTGENIGEQTGLRHQWGQVRLTFCSHVYWEGCVHTCVLIKCPTMKIFSKGIFCPGLALL